MPSTKRFRPRFSVRTLVVVVTLACTYFGCWEATKRQGVRDLNKPNATAYARAFNSPAAPIAPLILRVEEYRVRRSPKDGVDHHYYFWFFGYVAKLPYARSCSVAECLELMEAEEFIQP